MTETEIGAPVIILVEPQLGENIGMVARAMLNCGLEELRLVRPRDAWPNDKAVASASGADRVLDAARLYGSTAAAVADLQHVYASTARHRYMTKRVLTPRGASGELFANATAGRRSGILFGKEASGLDNDDIVLAESIITVPLNPEFSSLNLAMSTLIIGYEWYQTLNASPAAAEPLPPPAFLDMPKETGPATKAQLMGLFEHLEHELDYCGFLRNRQKRPAMVRNLRNMLGRAELTTQEVRTFRGIITCLVDGPHHHPEKTPPNPAESDTAGNDAVGDDALGNDAKRNNSTGDGSNAV